MNHRARKRFGQNFLVDPGVVTALLAAIDPQPRDAMVEIGPGLGALTAPLLARLERLHAVEIDRDLVARLKKNYPPERLILYEQDVLGFDFSALGGALRIVGNLPYNLSTPLLFHLADHAGQVRDMHFMLQREVVDRLVALPGQSAFGRLSVMLQYRFRMERLLEVPPESFDPPPQVHSAVVRLIPRPGSERLARDENRLAEIVKAAFSQRRKILRNTLKGILDENDFARLGIAPSARAEELSVEDYVRMVGVK